MSQRFRREHQMPEYYDAPEAAGLWTTPRFPSEAWEALRAVYPALTDRQRALIDLLHTGQTNQTAIAKIMGVSQPRIVAMLRSIRAKIETYPL